jgi:hypothetical protein
MPLGDNMRSGELPPVLDPQDAYAWARSITAEAALVAQLHDAARRGDPTVDERALLLRQAAVADRLALRSPTPRHVRAAADSARGLQDYDRAHGTWLGSYGPEAFRFDPVGGGRAYVRQEYVLYGR